MESLHVIQNKASKQNTVKIEFTLLKFYVLFLMQNIQKNQDVKNY